MVQVYIYVVPTDLHAHRFKLTYIVIKAANNFSTNWERTSSGIYSGLLGRNRWQRTWTGASCWSDYNLIIINLKDSAHCGDRYWVGDLVAGHRVQVVGGEDGRGGEGGRQAPAGQVAFFQPSIHQVDDHSDVQVQSGCGWTSPRWDLAIAET